MQDVLDLPPGHYYTPKDGFVKYYRPEYEDFKKADKVLDLELIRETLIEATLKRLMSDVPIGVLLSGGLDSSLTSSIAARLLAAQGKKLHSFSIGLDKDALMPLLPVKLPHFWIPSITRCISRSNRESKSLKNLYGTLKLTT
jgi:asparagine synthetase B (glutamine-hydrolysing)